jgi:hypothetical protein
MCQKNASEIKLVLLFLPASDYAPLFFSQKKSGRKEKGRMTAYQNKFSNCSLKFPAGFPFQVFGNFSSKAENLFLNFARTAPKLCNFLLCAKRKLVSII